MFNDNIVISCNSYWYAFNFRKSTIERFIELGFKVTVVAPFDEAYRAKVNDLGASVSDFRLNAKSTNPIIELMSFFDLFLTYRKLSPAVIFHFTPKNNLYGSLAAFFLNIPCINNISGRGKVFSNGGFLASLVTYAYKKILKTSSHIFFQNCEDLCFFKDLGVTSPGLFSVIPGSGADLDRFKYSDLPSDDVITFLMFGRLLTEKGVHEFLDAAKQCYSSKIEFILAGFLDEDELVLSSKIDRYARAGYLKYRGPTDNVIPLIENCHCVVLPSYYSEGIPKSLIESIAMGRPVITTDNIGCKEVFNGRNGYLIKPRVTQSLVNAVHNFVALSSRKRLAMSLESRNYAVSRFDEAYILSRYVEVVQRILLDKV
jgi:glycosyltransferase involved in cell wall biosynthesis